MSVTKNRPHVLALPEDDANRQLATGFQLDVDLTRQRQMQILPVASGWNDVLNRFTSEHLVDMVRYPNRHMVLLIDFDGKQDRLDSARAAVPTDISDRVFILGAWSEPEALRQANLGSYESIGLALAKDCREENDAT